MTDTNDSVQKNTSGLNSPIDITQFNYDDHWKEIEIDFDRVRESFCFFYLNFISTFFFVQPPGVGLGFSIAGGIDTPCISDSPAVVITRITEGGLADRDQRLK